MTLRVGSIVYATDQGLGILAKSFYDHSIITDVVVVDRAEVKSRPTHFDWFPGADVASSNDGRIHNLISHKGRRLVEQVDAMLFLETPFDWTLIDYCREKGVKTVLMPMHECMPERLPAIPDAFLCPSKLDYEWAIKQRPYVDCYQLPVPVEVPWRQRTRAEVFVHNAGHGGLKGRNGTGELLEALQYVQSPISFVLRTQSDVKSVPITPDYIDFSWIEGTAPYGRLFTDGDVFVFPEGFNGLSLVLQEARASGMLVMCGNRFPMNTWLPTEPLIPVSSYREERIGPPYIQYDRACFDPKVIAKTIDDWYGRDISDFSSSGREWAENNSWFVLGPKYSEVLHDLLT